MNLSDLESVIAELRVLAACALVAATAPFASAQTPADPRPANNPEQKPAFAGQTDAPEQKLGVAFDVVTVVEGLQNPWAVAFLPGGKMLITERPGRLRVLGADGKLSAPVTGLPRGVRARTGRTCSTLRSIRRSRRTT